MNVRKLKQELKSHGAQMISNHGPHETWVSAKGKRFYVPRHKEIKEPTAKAILRQALE